jgi:hypothetical protein
MRRLITTTALLILIGLPAAIAQTGNSGGSSTAVKNPTIPQAPIGHRQPRASDVPSERARRSNNPYPTGTRARPQDQEHLPRLLSR